MNAMDRLRRLGERHTKLRGEIEALRPQLFDAIRAAEAAGERVTDIVKASGYTREQVRRVIRGLV